MVASKSYCLLNYYVCIMITTFILCIAFDSKEPTHIVCVTQPAIYALPDFNLVSGCNDAVLREEAIKWFENGCKPIVKPARSNPPGFLEALDKVRQHREQINILELSTAVGISEKFLTLCIDDIKWKGAVVRIPKANRQNFIDAVKNLHFP